MYAGEVYTSLLSESPHRHGLNSQAQAGCAPRFLASKGGTLLAPTASTYVTLCLRRYIYERRGRMYAGKGLGSAVEWMRAKGHGFKSQVTAASGAADILVMQANAKKQFQVPPCREQTPRAASLLTYWPCKPVEGPVLSYPSAIPACHFKQASL